ncbi:oxidoreductase [Marivirga lumbricoides]|uniref:Oxidoreductase n=1 Tax=Marivirga lumbricoides TaxID=1046115 RepID=A0A2T4DQN3_9BACT|nr:oxidoreductase [Marivirga lumbricoides]
MNLQLENKTALVTGSTAGIGYAIAKQLASEGAIVTINGRKKESLIEAIDRLKKETGNENINGIAADFAKKEEVTHLIKSIPDVDILINNVGIFNEVDFADITDEEWSEVFEINVMSGVRLSRHYFLKMMQKNEGRIIFISSESALNIPTEMIHYGMTKTAQLSISRGLARLTKGSNVTVNAVLPGPTWSRANENGLKAQAEKEGKTLEEVLKDFFEKRRPTSLTQKFASTEEVAYLVAYVASPLSAATNGASLRVDGGVVNSIV